MSERPFDEGEDLDLVVDEVSGVSFRRIPDGSYTVGLSESERAAASELSAAPAWNEEEVTPSTQVELSSVWIADLPLTVSAVRALGHEDFGRHPHEPALLDRSEVGEIFDGRGWRLPWESEWETACRAGRSGLFAWGDGLPDLSQLDRWLSWDLHDAPRLNGWGFGGLFFGEFCLDRFEPYRSASTGVAEAQQPCVVKGGGAQFWPWQDDREWVWCASAMRMPSTALVEDRRAAARPVLVNPPTTTPSILP